MNIVILCNLHIYVFIENSYYFLKVEINMNWIDLINPLL